MKKILISALCTLTVSVTCSFAQTDTSSTPAAANPAPSSSMSMSNTQGMGNGKHACNNIATACEAAGFTVSRTIPGKNIWKDCVKPILAGQTVTGVTADPADVQACTAHKARWKMKHQNNMSMPSTSTPTAQTPAASQ